MKETTVFIEEIIKEMDQTLLTDEADNRYSFYSFTARFVFYFKKHMIAVLKEHLGERSEELAEYNAGVMYQLLYSASIRTMILELYKWKEEHQEEGLKELTANERYLVFTRRLREEAYFRNFCQTYHVLVRKLQQTIEHTLMLFQEAVQAAIKDKEEIQKVFQFDISEITKIEMTDGDSHNHGKRALVFTAGERKLLYKPHSLSTDIFLEHVYEELNHHISLDLKAPRSIDRNTYGWQEYIVKEACTKEEQFQRYFYRYGELAGIAYCLNMTDLHMENLIPNGEYPVIIDTETIISNDCYNFNKEKVNRMVCDTPKKLFNKTISRSVLNTLLLPVNLLGGIFDIDLSPLAINDSQKSETMTEYKIVNDFTDEIAVEAHKYERIFPADDLEHNPCKYLKEILDGFTECYGYILKQKTDFREFVKALMVERPLVVRQVLRPTYVYGKFADASNHPDYLTDMETQAKLIGRLKTTSYREDEKMSQQADMEIVSILNGDIPYFYEQVDSRDLQSIYGSIKDFYTASIVELVEEKISAMSRENLLTQQRMIRLSMSTLLKSNWNHENRDSARQLKGYLPYLAEDDMDMIKSIGDYLVQEAVWDDEHKFCIWISHALLTPKLKVCAAYPYLYDCGGTVLFLHHLAKATGEEKYRRTADGVLAGFDAQEEMLSLSAYNGIGSLLYIYYSLYKLWDDSAYYRKYQETLEAVFQRELTGQMPVDYINGLAGMAVLMEQLYEKEQDERLVKLAKAYTDYCIENQNQITLAGLAHGYAGLSLAAAGCYHICGEEKYYQAAMEFVETENQYYDGEKNNWKDMRKDGENGDPVYWCHGAAGISLARMKACEYLNNPAVCSSDMEKGIRKVEEDMGKLKDHSLCHGMFGAMDILISLAEQKAKYSEGEPSAEGCSDRHALSREQCWDGDGLEQLWQALKQPYQEVLSDMRQRSLVCGISNAYDMFSFMLGIPGMAYTMMRMHNPSLPSILLLEL